jgi:hypothetical protein
MLVSSSHHETHHHLPSTPATISLSFPHRFLIYLSLSFKLFFTMDILKKIGKIRSESLISLGEG